LAKQTVSQASTKAPLIPKSTDPRAELFYLLGKVAGTEEGPRICEIVIEHLMMKPTEVSA
jgi:hypothetical protein